LCFSTVVQDAGVADTVTYAERWSKRRPGHFKELDPQEARRRHDVGELYTVILGDPESADAYLEVRLEVGFVGVHFLDEDGRGYVTYLFAKQDGDDRLFLNQASRREFDEDGNVRRGQVYYFERDGTIHFEEKDYEKREAKLGEKRDDVSGNWEPVPAFGRYESIARLER
jgi:hypothetical protein